MSHFVHYVKRKVVLFDYGNPRSSWFKRNQPDDQGFDAPNYHLTLAVTGPAARVEIDDTIWLFSQLSSPWGSLPPALDARIVVSAISPTEVSVPVTSGGKATKSKEKKPGLLFDAGEGSSWVPLFDASNYLIKLKTVQRPCKSSEILADLLSYPEHHPGKAMQRMRELANPELLIDLERTIEDAEFDFVSYRLFDGTRAAFETCLQLMRGGRVVWWDRWCLPRRLAEWREKLNDQKLNYHILNQINVSERVWGIESKSYAQEGSFSLREKRLATTLGKYCPSP